MRLLNLELKNIGPFKSAELDFIGDGTVEKPPVTIITGENGTGKTIILDAIRGVLRGTQGGGFMNRDIVRNNPFLIKLSLKEEAVNELTSTKQNANFSFSTSVLNLAFHRYFTNRPNGLPKWIANYWTSQVSNEKLEIDNYIFPKPEKFLENALNGIQRNTEVIELITFFDFMKKSDNKKEKELGRILFDFMKKIIKKSITNGKFEYVSVTKRMPIISQLGYEIELNKLSSGNLYLIQRMIGLLGQMYAVAQLHDLPIEDICKTPGVLLIDEAENHLHPKWQKTFLNDILDIFPNLQIIVTTHSPFIVSSVENARVYVCESRINHAEVVDRTSDYSNRPIEEILVSPVFDTMPFNSKITNLLERRKTAIQIGDKDLENKIEAELKRLNPNHFTYLDIEQLLESISK
ncbi:MAG: AAA family ATPase [Saprospiraceae bacterium]